MKSKAHYKKCCELGINPNEGTEEGGEMTQCSGETDDETDSDGDEGNEGETESSGKILSQKITVFFFDMPISWDPILLFKMRQDMSWPHFVI